MLGEWGLRFAELRQAMSEEEGIDTQTKKK